ncbi:MAG: RidA family protein [Gemmatimonadetes bacterium]|nr:RidA family protein [Gemmatimonadota bacterium]
MLRPFVPVLAIGLVVAWTPAVHAQAEGGARTGDNVVTVAGEVEGFPFSPAIRAGGMLYLSGQVGNLPGTLEMPDGIAAQTRQTMENIKTVLEAAGATLYDVVKCTVFLDNMDDYWPMNEVYASYWEGSPPARSAFGADGLALGALLEIECLATDPAAE